MPPLADHTGTPLLPPDAPVAAPLLDVPSQVARALQTLSRHGVWHQSSRNPPVRSCADAARHRRRLGGIGIPLCDELKSLVFAYDGSSASTGYVVVHSRGHQRIDMDKAAKVAGGPLRSVADDELIDALGASYGTVTPLLLWGLGDVRHVVDDTVVTPFYPPYTMLTNSGHREHAVEFRPTELFAALPHTVIADVVRDDHRRVPRTTFGILTGNGPESGMLLWEKVNTAVRADARVQLRGDVGFPRVLIDSVPGMAQASDLAVREQDLRDAVVAGVDGLIRAGATVVTVACNTSQFFGEQIAASCERHGVRYVSLAEATGDCLRAADVKEFDLLGGPSVVSTDGWSGFAALMQEFDVHLPDSRRAEAISQLELSVKRDLLTPANLNRLRDLVNRYTRTDTVVLATTELSILVARQKGKQRSHKRIIDTLDVLAERMAAVYLDERIATGGA